MWSSDIRNVCQSTSTLLTLNPNEKDENRRTYCSTVQAAHYIVLAVQSGANSSIQQLSGFISLCNVQVSHLTWNQLSEHFICWKNNTPQDKKKVYCSRGLAEIYTMWCCLWFRDIVQFLTSALSQSYYCQKYKKLKHSSVCAPNEVCVCISGQMVYCQLCNLGMIHHSSNKMWSGSETLNVVQRLDGCDFVWQ